MDCLFPFFAKEDCHEVVLDEVSGEFKLERAPILPVEFLSSIWSNHIDGLVMWAHNLL